MRGVIRSHQQTLVASAARTTSGNSGALTLDFNPTEALFQILVTAMSGTSPALSIYLQFSLDSGTTWLDFGALLGINNVYNYDYIYATHPGTYNEYGSTYNSDAGLPNNHVRPHPLPPAQIRVKWVLGGTTPSWTFSVVALLDKTR